MADTCRFGKLTASPRAAALAAASAAGSVASDASPDSVSAGIGAMCLDCPAGTLMSTSQSGSIQAIDPPVAPADTSSTGETSAAATLPCAANGIGTLITGEEGEEALTPDECVQIISSLLDDLAAFLSDLPCTAAAASALVRLNVCADEWALVRELADSARCEAALLLLGSKHAAAAAATAPGTLIGKGLDSGSDGYDPGASDEGASEDDCVDGESKVNVQEAVLALKDSVEDCMAMLRGSTAVLQELRGGNQDTPALCVSLAGMVQLLTSALEGVPVA